MKQLVITCFLCLTYVLPAFTQDKTPLTLNDVANLKGVTGCVISADGSRIAYTVSVPADPYKENERASTHLYVYNVGTGQSTAFVTQTSVSDVKFRPKHNSITFLAKREKDSGTSVYEIPVQGGEASRLMSFKTSISEYDWHPDGEKLAFVASVPKAEDTNKLPYKPEIYEEELSVAGAWVSDASGGQLKQIITPRHIYHVAWNPAGTQIAYSATPTPLVDDMYTSHRIYIVKADLTAAGEVDHKAKLGEFVWSPDGKQIAFIGGEDKHDPTDGRLLVVGAGGGKPRLLNPAFPGDFDDIEWTTPGSIHFLASEGTLSSFGTISLDGEIKKIIDRVAVGFTHFSMAANKSVAFAGGTAMYPPELYYLKAGARNAERKSDVNPWLASRQLARQEVVKYKATDGVEIEGILIHPLNHEQAKSYPLITVVHGGPEAHYDHSWLTYYSMPGQVAAGLGYAVFYPNYRGSTGRGIEFSKLSQGDPGGKEFDDIIDGIDHLVGTGLADKARVGVTGGSYGGYATAWMSTRHTERFAAGVMFVGISNEISKWGTSDIPQEMFLVHSRKNIWDDFDFFLKRSPIYYAGQAKTPLLIMAGKDDTRVDPGQSYELYRHIKTRTNTPVRLVLYPGEGHGNRKATARFDYSMRMMRWFNNYLQGKDVAIPSSGVGAEEGTR